MVRYHEATNAQGLDNKRRSFAAARGTARDIAVGRPRMVAGGRGGHGIWSQDASLAATIVTQLRLPRAVLAIEVGAALGLSGAVLQGLTRNPLAEPGLLGVSAGAALGAVVAVYFGFAAHFATAAPLLG